jgi:hypothetical protein
MLRHARAKPSNHTFNQINYIATSHKSLHHREVNKLNTIVSRSTPIRVGVFSQQPCSIEHFQDSQLYTHHTQGTGTCINARIMHHDQARGKEMHTQERQDLYSNSRNNLIEHKHAHGSSTSHQLGSMATAESTAAYTHSQQAQQQSI